jgi:dienelactone hydrolase
VPPISPGEPVHQQEAGGAFHIALGSPRMWRFIAKPLDRFAIRSACGSVLPSPDGQSHLQEASELLRRGDFFSPAVEAAAVEFTSKSMFRFPSAIRTDSDSNNIVRGHFEVAAKNWQERPSVILLHGWNSELQYQWQLPFWSQLLARAGVNAFRFELPYHGSRRPMEPGAIRNFLSGNLFHVARATHQALADVRALALWLRAQGSPTVGLWGVSLGAWLTGLAVANQSEFDFAALLTPLARLDRALELAFCDPIRNEIGELDESFHSLNLIAHRPRVASERLLFVVSDFDLFAPLETVDELSAAWQPEVWRHTHGHISILLSNRIMRRIAQWMAAKGEASPSTAFAPLR